jgi:hypothetical protein
MHLVTCLYCGGSWLYAGANLAREQAAPHRCDVAAVAADLRAASERFVRVQAAAVVRVTGSSPEKATIEELRDWLDDALRLVELGGTHEERAAFRRRKGDLLARLFPPEDPS